MHLDDGRYSLSEFKLGENGIEDGAKHLCEIEKLIIKYNQNNKFKIDLLSFKMVITGSQYGYKREDVVFVVHIGCLKD